MRKFLGFGLLGLSMLANVGCVIPMYHSDPAVRTRELVFTSENLRAIPDTWERIWFLDMPDHSVPFRTHGGII